VAGDQAKKSKIQKSNPNASLKPVVIKTSDKDCLVNVRKNFLKHWIFKGVYHEFLAQNINTWDAHHTIITNLETVQKAYTVLAEGEHSE